jgi:hypothetical protein
MSGVLHGSALLSRSWTAIVGLGVAAILAIGPLPKSAFGQKRNDAANYFATIYSEHLKNRDMIRYSPRLQRLLDADKNGQDPIGKLDFDPITNLQDARISAIQTEPLQQDEARARVRAQFKNFGNRNILIFHLVRDKGDWMIDDIRVLRPKPWTLSRILAAP